MKTTITNKMRPVHPGEFVQGKPIFGPGNYVLHRGA